MQRVKAFLPSRCAARLTSLAAALSLALAAPIAHGDPKTSTSRKPGQGRPDAAAVHSSYRGELLVFPEATAYTRSGNTHDQNKNPAVDFIYTGHYNGFRAVAEYYMGKDEQELERLQVGWAFNPTSTLWAGRWHAPVEFWNIAYHHGAYLQTTISRPAIAAFEGDNGVLSPHLMGLLWDSEQWVGDQTVNYMLGIGAGPELTAHGLEPMDVLHPEEGKHHMGVTARIAWQPYDSLLSGTGVFITHINIPSDIAAFRENTQTLIGGYAAGEFHLTRVVGALAYIANDLDTPAGTRKESFMNAYVQAEHTLSANWTVYGRLEGTQGGSNDLYLAQFPGHVRKRGLIGWRYEMTRGQAIKLELSKEHTQDEGHLQAAIQWSAVLP